jgi:hypothetical protein
MRNRSETKNSENILIKSAIQFKDKNEKFEDTLENSMIST